jgi:hypothetical protein
MHPARKVGLLKWPVKAKPRFVPTSLHGRTGKKQKEDSQAEEAWYPTEKESSLDSLDYPTLVQA